MPSAAPPSLGLSRFTRFTAANTLFLIFAGGMVTSTGSGLAVPDWPLSYGMLFPPMVGGIFYEHGHRMVASWVGLLTLIQAAWIGQTEPRAWVRKLAYLSLAAVITQGLLGGLTVVLLLPPVVSVSHACLAQAFFSLTVILAYVTYPPQDTEPLPRGRWKLAAWVAAAIYVQLILGALMRHLGAGLAIQTFPKSGDLWIPAFENKEIVVHFAHRAWALVVTLAVLGGAGRLFLDSDTPTATRRLSLLTAATVLLQFGLGAVVVLAAKPPKLTSLHVVNGAFLLGLWVLIACQLKRREAKG